MIELDKQILLQLDIKTLTNICFLNKAIRDILFCDKQFWLDKFRYDKFPILNNPPSFQEYIKILSYKNKAEKILLINDCENQFFTNKGNIFIDVRNSVDILLKLLPENADKINATIQSLNLSYFYFFISMKPVANYNKCNEICLFINDVHSIIFINQYDDILSLLIRSLHYKLSIRDSLYGVDFTSNINNDNTKRIGILLCLNYLLTETFQLQINRLKYHIDKK